MNIKASNKNEYWLIIAAFAAVYFIWGSTYLGIKYAIETLPPFLMAGIRFLIAGGLLFTIAWFRTEEKPTLRQWKDSSIIGALLLLCGNGIVVWAEHFIDSGTAALLITLEPIWVLLLLWFLQNKKPSGKMVIAMIVGLTGMFLLTGVTYLSVGFQKVDMKGVIGISFSTLAWAFGSLYSIKADIPKSSVMATGMQMLSGGLMLLITAGVMGEFQSVNIENFSSRSLLAFGYLTFFGSIIGYTAYSFLLKKAHPNHVSTYAYINPVIAVFLGWFLADEKVTAQTIIASVLLIGAVVVITRFSGKEK
jgi:drug/metabolite transporter (DMT)-like permease